MAESNALSSYMGNENLTQRKRQAYQLSLRGYKVDEIASIMKKSEQTIRKYLKEYKVVLNEVNENVHAVDMIAEVRETFYTLKKEAWSNYSKAEKTSDKINSIKLIAKLATEELKALHNLGFVDRSPQRVEHQHNHSIDNQISIDISDERLDSLAAIVLGNDMGLDPQDVLRMSGGDSEYPGLPTVIDAEFEESKALPLPYQDEFDIEE
jgi:predicted transcriptional regulator